MPKRQLSLAVMALSGGSAFQPTAQLEKLPPPFVTRQCAGDVSMIKARRVAGALRVPCRQIRTRRRTLALYKAGKGNDNDGTSQAVRNADSNNNDQSWREPAPPMDTELGDVMQNKVQQWRELVSTGKIQEYIKQREEEEELQEEVAQERAKRPDPSEKRGARKRAAKTRQGNKLASETTLQSPDELMGGVDFDFNDLVVMLRNKQAQEGRVMPKDAADVLRRLRPDLDEVEAPVLPPEPAGDWRDFVDTPVQKETPKKKPAPKAHGEDLARQLASKAGFSVAKGPVQVTPRKAPEAQEPSAPGDAQGLLKAVAACEKAKDPERVMQLVRAAAGNEGTRDDQVFGLAIRALARLGRLDLSMQVQSVREELSGKGKLQGADPEITRGLAVACCRAGREKDARRLLEQLVALEGDGVQAESEVVPELLAMVLRRTDSDAADTDQAVQALMQRAMERVPRPPLTLQGYNHMIRLLGKASRLTDVFALLDALKVLGLRLDHETYDYLATAVVKDVSFAKQAVSMKTLPPAKELSEVVFVGRSNVGKSSLVNMLVNRKALAPTSQKPGKTQHFNYYIVNKGRVNVPSFYLVDVPGLGYAAASEGKIESWRATLERYLAVRENLKVVFHLVDSKIGMQPADIDLVGMMNKYNEGRSQYVLVLTKADRVSKKAVQNMTDVVRQQLAAAGYEHPVEVVLTSSESKLGRDTMWKYLKLVSDSW